MAFWAAQKNRTYPTTAFAFLLESRKGQLLSVIVPGYNFFSVTFWLYVILQLHSCKLKDDNRIILRLKQNSLGDVTW